MGKGCCFIKDACLKNFSVIFLAAGQSTRFGRENKLLRPFNSKPLLSWGVEVVSRLGFAQKIAVLGCDAATVKDFIPSSWQISLNRNFRLGMGSSIACGARSLSFDRDGVFILPADLPLLPASVFYTLAKVFDHEKIISPQYQNRQGHPVLFPQQCFLSLRGLAGDQGGKRLLRQFPHRSLKVDVAAICQDIDTRNDLSFLSLQGREVP